MTRSRATPLASKCKIIINSNSNRPFYSLSTPLLSLCTSSQLLLMATGGKTESPVGLPFRTYIAGTGKWAEAQLIVEDASIQHSEAKKKEAERVAQLEAARLKAAMATQDAQAEAVAAAAAAKREEAASAARAAEQDAMKMAEVRRVAQVPQCDCCGHINNRNRFFSRCSCCLSGPRRGTPAHGRARGGGERRRSSC